MVNRYVLAGALALGMAGCFGDRPPVEPKPESYGRNGTVLFPVATNTFPEFLYILDVDKDGIADAIGANGWACFFVKGYENRLKLRDGAVPMTPELRDLATKSMKASGELSYKMDLVKYLAEMAKRKAAKAK